MQKMVGRSWILGVPRVDGIEARDTPNTVQTKGASHTSQAFVLGRSSRGYTFEACVIGGVRVRCSVGEVDVLRTFGEVLDDSKPFGVNGSGTWWSACRR